MKRYFYIKLIVITLSNQYIPIYSDEKIVNKFIYLFIIRYVILPVIILFSRIFLTNKRYFT